MSKEAVERTAERLKKNSNLSSEQAHRKAVEIARNSEKTAKHKGKKP